MPSSSMPGRLAHGARRAVAGDEIARRDLDRFARGEIGRLRHDAVGMLREAVEAAAIAQADAVEFGGRARDDRIEHELRAPGALFRAFRRRTLVALARIFVAREKMTGEARAEHDVELVVVGKSGVDDAVLDAPAAAELHRSRRHHRAARQIDAAVALLDQQAFDAAPAEIERERQADRAAADDEDRGFHPPRHGAVTPRPRRSLPRPTPG